MWSVALAAEDSHGEHGQVAETHADGGHSGGGMPQLDATTYASQVFWLVIAFVVLFLLLKNKALPRVADILETRQDKIAADLDRAAALQREAEEAMQEHQRMIAEAQAKAQAQLAAARERLKAEQAAREAELEGKLQQQLADAEARIQSSRDEALAAIEKVAVGVAQSATQRLIGVEVSEADANAAIKSAQQKAA